MQEKRFLYNRIYKNGNERSIDLQNDRYFYKVKNEYLSEYIPCQKDLSTEEKILIFLRKLEKKGILQSHGNQTMIIPQQVWDILVKKSDEIFKGLNK